MLTLSSNIYACKCNGICINVEEGTAALYYKSCLYFLRMIGLLNTEAVFLHSPYAVMSHKFHDGQTIFSSCAFFKGVFESALVRIVRTQLPRIQT
jgi:hypothetical protein